jgi:hypothetical protein
MSLETALQENTAAIQALIARLNQSELVSAAGLALANENEAPAEYSVTLGQTVKTTDVKNVEVAEKTEEKKPAAQTASSPRGAKPPAQVAKAAAPEQQPEQAVEVKYESVKESVIKVNEACGHEVIVALLARYGVKNGKELKPEQWAAFIEDAKNVLAGAYNPVDAELA